MCAILTGAFTVLVLYRGYATCPSTIIVTCPRETCVRNGKHTFASTCTHVCEIRLLSRRAVLRPCQESIARLRLQDPAASTSQGCRSRVGIIYLPGGAPWRKMGKGGRRCSRVCARVYVHVRVILRFLLYSTFPGEWRTNVFKSAPFVPVDVYAWATRVSRRIMRMRSCVCACTRADVWMHIKII